MVEINPDCRQQCPYAGWIDFESWAENCKGVRIRLDTGQPLIKDGCIIGEFALNACGSSIGPDTELPTMSIVDWANTPLSLGRLLELHRRGLLPDQG